MTEEEMKARIAELETSLTKAETEKKAALGEKFKAATDLKTIQEAKEAADAEAERAKGDIAAIEKRLTDKFQKEIDKLTSERDAAASDLKTVRVDNEITRALAEGSVFDHMLQPLTYQFKAQAKYENGVAEIDGKPLGEYIAEYLGGEVGSHFRRGSTSSGAGASGNTSTTIIKDHGFTKENFASKTGEWMALVGTDPATAKQAAIDAGRPDLASDL